MRYRRLGRTELLVSEVGLTGRALTGVDPEVAVETLRAAITAGISLIALDARADLPDVEPLIGAVTDFERPRLTVITVFPTLPPAADLAPAVEAAAVRLEAPVTATSPQPYLDVLALPGGLTEAHREALEELRARGTIRYAAVATSDAAIATAALEAGWAEVLVAPLNLPAREQMRPAIAAAAALDAGVVLAGRVIGGRSLERAPLAGALAEVGGAGERAGRALVAWGLSEPWVHAVAAGARSPAEVRELAAAASRAPLTAEERERLEAAARR